jgi:phospholipid/cholesterol/gamma-HCH transport system substrate-binding protein
MTQRAKLLQIGLFVVAAILLLGTLILVFDSLPRLFKPAKLYTIRFDEATGVASGTPVRRFGVRIGEVRQVVIDEDRAIVRVVIGVEPQFTLRRNEQPTLTTAIIGSNTVIDFIPQQGTEGQPPDRSPLAPGAEIVGVRQASIGSLLGQASEVVPSTQEALNEMRKSLQRLERMSPLTEDTLKEYRDLAHQLNQAMPDLRQTNTEIQKLARDVDRQIPAARQTIDDVGAAARTYQKLGERLDVWFQTNQDALTKAVNQLNTVLTQVSGVLSEANQRNLAEILKNTRQASERLDPTLRDIDETVKESQRTIQHLDRTLTQTDQVLGDIQKMTRPFSQRSETISRNLDESLSRLNQTLGDINAMMRTIDSHDGTVQRLLMDPSLYANINAAACQLALAMKRVDQMLKDLNVFADKLARHPELLGVRGAIRPDSGLKDPPKPYNPPGNYGPPVLVPGPPPVLQPSFPGAGPGGPPPGHPPG